MLRATGRCEKGEEADGGWEKGIQSCGRWARTRSSTGWLETRSPEHSKAVEGLLALREGKLQERRRRPSFHVLYALYINPPSTVYRLNRKTSCVRSKRRFHINSISEGSVAM